MSYLVKQNKLAKQLQAKNKKLTWQQAVAAAAKQLKSSKTKPVKKKVGAYKVIEPGETKATKVKAVYRTARTKKGTFKKGGMNKVAGTQNSNLAQITATGRTLTELQNEIKWLTQTKKEFKTAAERKKVQTTINDKRKQFATLKKYFNTLATFK